MSGTWLDNGTGPREVLAPGRSQTEAARALIGARRRVGIYPYQWLFPGPNAKSVRASGTVAVPTGVGVAETARVLRYKVPEGMRFSLRGVVLECTSPDWEQASANLVFSVHVVDSPGPRPVDWLGAVNTSLGSRQQPFPIGGRLEFQAFTTIVVDMTVNTTMITPAQGFGVAMLVGHTYPNAEAGDA